MAPILLWQILVVSLLITVVKYLMGIIMRFRSREQWPSGITPTKRSSA